MKINEISEIENNYKKTEKKNNIFTKLRVAHFVKNKITFCNKQEQLFRLNTDIIITFTENSIFENFTSFKKVIKKHFKKKKSKFDSFELELCDINEDPSNPQLVIDKLDSLNNYYAKNLAQLIKKFSFFDFNDYFLKYENTEEYYNFIKKIEIAKNNRKGIPYIVFYSKYVPNRRGYSCYKINYSSKLIEILYNGNLSELYKDCTKRKNNFPFLGYVFDYQNFNEINQFISAFILLDKEIKFPNLVVDLTRDGTNLTKASSSFIVFPLYNPKNSKEVLEIVLLQQFKCFEPHKSLGIVQELNLEKDFLKNTKKDEKENVNEKTHFEQLNLDFFEKYYK